MWRHVILFYFLFRNAFILPQLEGKFASVNALSLSHLTFSIRNTDMEMSLDCGFMWLMWSNTDSYTVGRQVNCAGFQHCTCELCGFIA